MVKKSFVQMTSCLLVLLMFLTACNLAKSSTPTPLSAQPTLNPPSGGSSPASSSGLSVQITSPAANAQVSGSNPLAVDFVASGGPFLEFDLKVDNAVVASQPASTSAVQISGSLQWDAPVEGAHTLELDALDISKNISSAEIQVQIVGGTPAKANTPSMTSFPTITSASTSGLQLRLVNVMDGGTIQGALDDTGNPVVTLKIEISGPSSPLFIITMTANGDIVPGQVRYTGGVLPYTAELKWSPLSGSGKYSLVVTVINDIKETAQTTAQVTVTGIPAFTDTPPPLDQAAAQKRFTQLYQQLYGIHLPAPSMQRFDFPNLPNRSRWISDAYYKGQRYYIELFDDTHYELSPVCIPIPRIASLPRASVYAVRLVFIGFW